MPVSLPLPRPVLFGLFGGAVGLLAALVVGQLVWWLFPPLSPPEPEPPAPPPVATPHPQLALTASANVSVYVGETNTVAVRVARNQFDGPVNVKFAPPPGLSVKEFTIQAGEVSGSAEIRANADAKPGAYRVSATAGANANGAALGASATIEMTVLSLPPPAPRLAVTTSPRVPVSQRGKNTFAVRIARGEFDDPVTVSFDNLPDGVKLPPITIPAGATEAAGELTAEGTAPAGAPNVTATARAKPTGFAIFAEANLGVEILAIPKVPVDVVFVLDCTGSMKKTVEGVSDGARKFAEQLARANFDVRFGLVGFQDTTLGQPLKTPRLDGERMSSRVAALRTAMLGLRLGGGGGEGESSLDGIDTAASYPLRESAVRVLVLVTDGGPKKSDGYVKSPEELVKHLKAKKIDQLHIVALPEHKKQFEPLWEGAKGKYFDLKAASEADAFDKLLADVAKAITEAIPESPPVTVAPGGAAPDPVLPQRGFVKPAALPPGATPPEPKCEAPAEKLAEQPAEAPEPTPDARQKQGPARAVWAIAIVLFVCGALVAGQVTFLPGKRPSVRVAAVGYGVGIAAGVLAGPAGYFAFDLMGMPLLARITGASAFGVCVGAIVPLAERLIRVPLEVQEPLELDDEPVSVPAHKPNIAPPKSPDGCPGCGRTIPGVVGVRYCMLCDQTF